MASNFSILWHYWIGLRVLFAGFPFRFPVYSFLRGTREHLHFLSSHLMELSMHMSQLQRHDLQGGLGAWWAGWGIKSSSSSSLVSSSTCAAASASSAVMLNTSCGAFLMKIYNFSSSWVRPAQNSLTGRTREPFAIDAINKGALFLISETTSLPSPHLSAL